MLTFILNVIQKFVYDFRQFVITESNGKFYLQEKTLFGRLKFIFVYENKENCLNCVEKLYEESLLTDFIIVKEINVLSKEHYFRIYEKRFFGNNSDCTRYMTGNTSEYTLKTKEDALEVLKDYMKDRYTFHITDNTVS